MNTFILFSMFILNVFAQENNTCSTNKNINQVKDILQKMEWWAASDQQITNSPCSRTKPYSTEEMLSWLTAHPSPEKKKDEKFYGIELTEEDPKLAGALKDLLTSHDIIGRIDPKTQKTFKSNCKNAICAAQEIFGKKEGIQLLLMHERYGYNGSVHQSNLKNSSAWTASELDQVLMALSYYPEKALPIDTNSSFVHFKRGYSLKIYGDDSDRVIANSSVEVFDPWDKLSNASKQSALVHEIGHRMAGKMDADESPTWLELSGWTKKTNPKNKNVKWKSSKPSALISDYGRTNPDEDFAECVVAYRFNPAKLQKASPEKYQFLKSTVFDGLEYTSPEACNQKNAASLVRTNQVNNRIGNFMKSKDSLKNSSELITTEKECAEAMLDSLTDQKQLPGNTKFYHCVQNSFSSAICSEVEKSNNRAYASFNTKLLRSQRSNCAAITPEFAKICIDEIHSEFKKALGTAMNRITKKSDNYCGNYRDASIPFYKSKFDPSSVPYDNKDMIKNAQELNNLDNKLIDIKVGSFSEKVCETAKSNRNKIKKWWDGKLSEDEINTAINSLVH